MQLLGKCPSYFFFDGTDGDDLQQQCDHDAEATCCEGGEYYGIPPCGGWYFDPRPGVNKTIDYRARAVVSKDACSGTFSCTILTGAALNGACHGAFSCYQKRGIASEGSCVAEGIISNGWIEGACYGHEGFVGRYSCRNSHACTHGIFDVAESSCNSIGSCERRGNFEHSNPVGEIHSEACNAPYACARNNWEIPEGECSAPCSCWGLKWDYSGNMVPADTYTPPDIYTVGNLSGCNTPCGCADLRFIDNYSFPEECLGVGGSCPTSCDNGGCFFG